MKIEIKGKEIELNSSEVEVQDFNGLGEFNPGAVQVAVHLDRDHLIAYQTSGTMDVGGISSDLSLNRQSGSYDHLIDFLEDQGIDIDEDDDLVDAIAEDIKSRLGVQELYDEYLDSLGSWEPSTSGMDANSEVFVLD